MPTIRPPDLPTASCTTCGVERDTHPSICPICSDERQYVPRSGQRWTTLGELAAATSGSLTETEPCLWHMRSSPHVGIGQSSILVRTSGGNLLFDPPGYLSDDVLALVDSVGGVAAIAASHPHMYGAQVSWSHAFDDAPIYVCAADSRWLGRGSSSIELWSESVAALPGLTLHQIGGHFPGSCVAQWDDGAGGAGALMTGDTVGVTPDGAWITAARGFPTRIPLSPAVALRMSASLGALRFDRIYDAFEGCVTRDAGAVVTKSLQRYADWAGGKFDHLT